LEGGEEGSQESATFGNLDYPEIYDYSGTYDDCSALYDYVIYGQVTYG